MSSHRTFLAICAAARLRHRQGLCLVLALGLLASSAAPLSARPPTQCRLGNQSDYLSIVSGTTTEATRKELRLRVLVDALEDAETVFRGRLFKRWYLSDVLETNVPLILEVYESVTVLKGSMPEADEDGRAYIIREKICEGRCWLGALPEVTDGHGEPERVVLAMKNTLPNPAQAVDWLSGAVVYSGRIDALAGPCDPRHVNVSEAAMLLASPGEVDRLRRTYPPRTESEKRRDIDFLVARVFGER